MKKQKTRWATTARMATLLSAAVVLSWIITGCEEDSGNSLGVEPSNSTIGPSDSAFILRVVSGTRDLSMPLEWSVSNPERGSISHSSGDSAVYIRTANNGVNTVTVRDQYGAKGAAFVEQVAYETTQPPAPAPPSPEPEPEPEPTTQLAVAGGEPSVLGVPLLASPEMSNFRNNLRGDPVSYDFVQNGQSGRVSNIQYNSLFQAISYEMSYAGSSVRVFNISRDLSGRTVSYNATVDGQSYQYP